MAAGGSSRAWGARVARGEWVSPSTLSTTISLIVCRQDFDSDGPFTPPARDVSSIASEYLESVFFLFVFLGNFFPLFFFELQKVGGLLLCFLWLFCDVFCLLFVFKSFIIYIAVKKNSRFVFRIIFYGGNLFFFFTWSVFFFNFLSTVLSCLLLPRRMFCYIFSFIIIGLASSQLLLFICTWIIWFSSPDLLDVRVSGRSFPCLNAVFWKIFQVPSSCVSFFFFFFCARVCSTQNYIQLFRLFEMFTVVYVLFFALPIITLFGHPLFTIRRPPSASCDLLIIFF